MAHSKTFFGLRKGSTKSSTFQIFRGQQITKDRVAKNSNPQTSRQGLQRMRVAAVSNAAARLRPLISQSFEGVPYGEESVREFMRVNMAKNGPCQFQCWPKKGENTPGLSTLMVSRGSLPTIDCEMEPFDIGATPFLVLQLNVEEWPDDSATIDDYKKLIANAFINTLALKEGDQLTFLSQVGKYEEIKDENGFNPYWVYKPGVGFVISRIVISPNIFDSKEWQLTTLDNYTYIFFNMYGFTNGYTSMAFERADDKLNVYVEVTKQALAQAGFPESGATISSTIIHSRYSNGRWLRSTQCLPKLLCESYVQTADEAWPSYLKTGESTKYLNEGSDSVNIIGG